MKKTQPQHPAYSSMLAAADGFLTRFETDLTKHDRGYLATIDPAQPFVWILRDSSTHLRAFRSEADGSEAIRYAEMVADSFRGSESPLRLFVWDGCQLVPFDSLFDLSDWLERRSEVA